MCASACVHALLCIHNLARAGKERHVNIRTYLICITIKEINWNYVYYFFLT